MKKSTLFVIPLLLIVLAGCELASKFIPPIEVGQVFGIGDASNPTTIKAPAFQDPNNLGDFLPQATGALDYEETEITFDNIELPDLYGFTLDALWLTLGLSNTITLEPEDTTSTPDYPDAFTLTAFEGYIRVSDNQNIRKPAEYHFQENTLNLEYTRTNNCNPRSCEYESTATPAQLEDAMLFTIPERDGTVVKDLMVIVSEGGINTAHAKVRLTADASDGTLEGLQPTLRITNPSTRVSLGG